MPTELRLKIWKYALPGERVIQIIIKVITSEHSRHLRGLKFSSVTPVPAMLHACPESRLVALEHYELGMATHLSEPRIYVDYEKDTIYFGEANITEPFTLAALLRDMPEKELLKIRQLGMSQHLWNEKPFCNNHVLMDFTSLEKVILAMERPGAWGSKNVTLIPPKASDHTFCSIFDEYTGADDNEEYYWPHEIEGILMEHMVESFKPSGRDLPDLEFKVLVDKDKIPVSKLKKCHKSKGKKIAS
jgi:hypothetical protein